MIKISLEKYTRNQKTLLYDDTLLNYRDERDNLIMFCLHICTLLHLSLVVKMKGITQKLIWIKRNDKEAYLFRIFSNTTLIIFISS